MKNELGIMQGRLSPKYEGRYQSHPPLHWQNEFFVAKEMGLQLVEFILDSWYLPENPLLDPNGRDLIKRLCERSGVGVKSICADVFMDITFVNCNKNHNADKAIHVLRQTIDAAVDLKIRDIVIPCVDRSSIAGQEMQSMFIDVIAPLCREAAAKGVRLNLEADWAPQEFLAILDSVGKGNIWVNYDSGNSASLGFNPEEELEIYGDRISDFHIKDRKLNDVSVKLGTGDTNFDVIISWLQSSRFDGPLIFQAARAEDYVEDLILLRQQISWFKQKWEEKQNER